MNDSMNIPKSGLSFSSEKFSDSPNSTCPTIIPAIDLSEIKFLYSFFCFSSIFQPAISKSISSSVAVFLATAKASVLFSNIFGWLRNSNAFCPQIIA